ncbi:MAG: hypothetical protein ABSC95_19100 [Acetobacteraceae bacterium]
MEHRSCSKPDRTSRRARLRIVACTLALLALATQASAAPQVVFGNIVRMQPGWVRLYLEAIDPPPAAQFQVVPGCAAPGNVASITTTVSVGTNGFVDFKDNLTWLADNGLPAPCTITTVTANLLGTGPTPVLQATEAVNIQMDLPLSHLTPDNTPVQPTGSSVSLTPPPPYAAYPPLLLVVSTVTGASGLVQVPDGATQYPVGTPAIGFVEVEELPARSSVGQTVGLRALATFLKLNGTWTLAFELGGG